MKAVLFGFSPLYLSMLLCTFVVHKMILSRSVFFIFLLFPCFTILLHFLFVGKKVFSLVFILLCLYS